MDTSTTLLIFYWYQLESTIAIGILLRIYAYMLSFLYIATITKVVHECRSACYFVRQKFPSNRLVGNVCAYMHVN